jgi:beta-lactamase class D
LSVDKQLYAVSLFKIWASLIGLGAAVYGIGRNRNMKDSVQNAMNNFRNSGQISKMTSTLVEFSKELVPNKDSFRNK